jgi:3-oxoadipate enol-lactonase / 4-carboxymuconolactone decarboxylase
MPLIEAGGLRQYYRIDGRDDRPALFFSHSLGCDHTQWDEQAGAFEPYFRVVRYDTRGHGATEAPPGDYTIEILARDALALADALGIQRFDWCGLSLGGMIGQWLAAHAAERVSALVLANTSANFPDPGVMESRRKTVLEQGMAALEETAMGRFFTPEDVAANTTVVQRMRRVFLATDPRGYAGCCAAIRDMDQRPLLKSIHAPTCIIVGDRDVSTPWRGHGEILAQSIAGSRVEHLPTAHLGDLGAPRSFNAALARFLLPPPADTFEAGLEKRRAILGNTHVDRAISNATGFNRAFQEMLTRFAWGTVWQRPGLDDRTRRMLVLTTTAALGRWEEFRMHIRAALGGGMEPCDIEETLLQLAAYAGLPAANTAFQIAMEEIGRK